MTGIISVKDFTRNATKITDHIPGRKTNSYKKILHQLEKYHNSNHRGNWQELLLLQELHRVALNYIFHKQNSRSEAIEMLAYHTEMRLKTLIANIPMISWPQFDPATVRAGRQLRGKDIALLTEVMSNFPAFEYSNPFTDLPNTVQQRLDELWLLSPSSHVL